MHWRHTAIELLFTISLFFFVPFSFDSFDFRAMLLFSLILSTLLHSYFELICIMNQETGQQFAIV